MSKQVIKKNPNCDYKVSYSLDCGSYKSIMSQQKFVDLMTQHRLEEIYSVNSTKSSYEELSSELSNGTSIEFLGH
jgi:hypothetical protein